MDEFFVTNQQFVDFLNHNLSRINLENGVVKGDGANWYLLGEVHEGYEPIVYRNNEFHVSDPAYTSSPVLRVTGYGASAFAGFFGRRLPTEAEWLFATTKGVAIQSSEQIGTNNYSESMNMKEMMSNMMGNDWSEKNLSRDNDGQFANNSIKGPPPAAFFKPNEFNLLALNQGIGEWGLRTLSSISEDKLQDNLFVVMGTLEQHKKGNNSPPPILSRFPWEGFEEVGFRTTKDASSKQ
jgi:serine/threonine-protein kinase